MGEPVDQTDGATLVVTCDRTVDTVTGDDAPERDCGDLGIQVGLVEAQIASQSGSQSS